MEATSITQLLKSLCDYTHWKYAVFWKLNHYCPMTLTWEDGYYGSQKTNEAVESMCGDINLEASDEVFSSSIESNGGFGDYSVQLLMTEMPNLKYILGEGIIGKIALTGDHCWVFCKDIITSNLNTDLISEGPYECLLQFASGIKTIVLVSVRPYGVLQFGSFEAVEEDLAFVANVKEKFNSIYCKAASTTILSANIDIQASSLSALTECLIDSLDESSIANNTNGSIWLNPTVPSFLQDEYYLFREDQPESLIKANKNEIISQSLGVSNDPSHVGVVDMKLNQMEEKRWACSRWVNNVGVFGDILNGTCSHSGKDMTEQQFGGTDTDHKSCQDVDSLFHFSSDCELYRALGPGAGGQTSESLSKYLSVEDTYSSSALISNKNKKDHIEDLWLPKEGNAEYLLDAVVGNASAETTLSISNIMPAITLPREDTASILAQIPSEKSTLILDYSDPKSYLTPAFVAEGGDEYSDLITSASFDGNSSILIDETQQEKIYGHMHPKSGPKISRTSKKRARVGNTPRPRPRDRQLIMDRMKELRELVPDGAGCGIESLLDQTIKHMLYLRNMTTQAEKLKQCLLQEVPECKKKIAGSNAGRSFAFDLESELQVCPIIIEDLGCSGNMLIGMICSEQGLFLEIANVIRRMELTILKGVLENCSSTTWACFIVEVPIGFRRMDILCPLLHLLQLRKNPVQNRI